jgi:hypothetical protein
MFSGLLIAATLIGVFANPALAIDKYYIVFDKTKKTCFMSRTAPSETEKFSMMGIYGSEADALLAVEHPISRVGSLANLETDAQPPAIEGGCVV